ncbi:hypothetical protein QEH52_15790 [Coraliomargarita sp. SDUM461003]|uniref:GNAT family N-acetyltransferase n=2 Tax=Thalassobacterium TaxID=3410851 RepID=A0ABU1AXU6_9BACT|nr:MULTISPECIES: hypothetical protein [unclassified Coraliomargarita]MDQ8194493.1 hypothetical protein [Coraliomargarita sp. SDUM461004]MDQ8208988.1 hypothetical protein [Coraliomargarita sp. SDUM461003]
MNLREATEADFDRIWPIFRDIARRGDTYAYDPGIEMDEARRLWLDLPRIASIEGRGFAVLSGHPQCFVIWGNEWAFDGRSRCPALSKTSTKVMADFIVDSELNDSILKPKGA